MFFERMRLINFAERLSDEIYYRIFPHLRNEADYGYPFAEDNELVAEMIREKTAFMHRLLSIERQAESMGKAYAESFRYVLYRDLNERLAMYSYEGERHVQPLTPPIHLATRS